MLFIGGLLIVGIVVLILNPATAPPPPIHRAPADVANEITPLPAPIPRPAEATVPIPPPSPPPPAVKPDPSVREAAKTEFRVRRNETRKKAMEHLEEARRELVEEKKAAGEAAAALRDRLSTRPVTLALRGGATLAGALVRSFTMQEAEIDAGGKQISVPWDSVELASLRSAADSLFEASSAKDQFERGRFFIARRMWTEAGEAFERAGRLGEDFVPRVLEFKDVLTRLASGKGGFRGSARRAGRESVLLGYDWRDPRQLEDWTEGLMLSDGTATLESKVATLRGGSEDPFFFSGELAVELKVASTAPMLLGFFVGPTGGYEVEIGPAGATLYRIDPARGEKDRRRAVAKSESVKIVAGTTHDLRIRAKNWRITISVDRHDTAFLEDAPSKGLPPSGSFSIGVAGGKLTLGAPLLLRGRARREELDTRLGEAEVLVRRALESELDQIRDRRERNLAMRALGVTPDLALSSDDPYFISRIGSFTDLVEGYEKLKKSILGYLGGHGARDFDPEEWERKAGEMIAKYPEVPSLYFLRSAYHDDAQERALAKADLAKALELFPEFPEALLRRASYLLESRDLAAALEEANRAIDVAPDLAEAYVMRARATFATSPAAMESYLEDLALARKLDPGDAEAAHYFRVLPREARGPRDLGCRFATETAHYLVTTDIGDEATRRYGEALEAAWGHYVETFKGIPLQKNRRKPRVAIFQTAENYHMYFELISESRGMQTLGIFRPEYEELVLFESADRRETMETLFHEAFHHFMTLMTGAFPPYWYNEGMADFMGGIEVEGAKVVKRAVVLENHVHWMRYLIEEKQAWPFEDLMLETPREFYGPNADLKYAQAWSMIHFFHEAEEGKYRPLIAAYFEELRLEKSPKEAYEAVFKEKVTALETAWKYYVRRLRTW